MCLRDNIDTNSLAFRAPCTERASQNEDSIRVGSWYAPVDVIEGADRDDRKLESVVCGNQSELGDDRSFVVILDLLIDEDHHEDNGGGHHQHPDDLCQVGPRFPDIG